MPAFLTGPLLKYAVLAIAFLGLGAVIYVQHLKLQAKDAKIAELQAQVQQVTDVANRNAAEIREVTAARDQFRSDAETARADLATQRKAAVIQVNQLKKEIADATAANECPVAPSVVAALRGLSGSDAGPDGDRGAGDQAPGAGGADGAVRGPPANP